MKNNSKILLFLIAILAILMACAPLEIIEGAVQDMGRSLVEQMEEEAARLAQEKWEEIKLEIEDMAADAFDQMGNGAEEQLERVSILGRAVEWEVKNPVYNSGLTFNEYTSNDSGFISFLWELEKPGFDNSQFLTEGVAIVIPVEDLHMGDAVNNNGFGELGHMLMFISWVSKTNMTFSAYEFTTDGIERNNYTFESLSEDSWTIQQFENDPDFIAKGPYEAQKWIGFAD